MVDGGGGVVVWGRVNCKQYGGPGWGAGPTGPASSHTNKGRLSITTMVTVLLSYCVTASHHTTYQCFSNENILVGVL